MALEPRKLALRACLLLTASAGLGACATGGAAAPIDYRSAGQVHRRTEPAITTAAAPAPSPAMEGRTYSAGPPSDVPAIVEAKALTAQSGRRPGGSLRQAKDDPAARRIAVLAGDTLYDISMRYSVNLRALIETNDLAPPYALDRGDVLNLPPPNIHVVERGETLYSVSRRYNVDTRSLAVLNGLARPWTVWPGDELLLPPLAREEGREPARTADMQVQPVKTVATPPEAAAVPPSVGPATPRPAPAKTSRPAPTKTVTPPSLTPPPIAPPLVVASEPGVAPPPRAPKPPAVSGSRDFAWPLTGRVLKAYGVGAAGVRNDGVNIAAPRGAEIRAAGNGEVVYAGNELAGFGNLVLIRHPGGWVTAYAHADSVRVKEGDLVNRGEVVATVGSTGNAGAPQLHFELRKGKEPVDPAQYLPPLDS